MSSSVRNSQFIFIAMLSLLAGLFLAFDTAILPCGFVRGNDTGYTLGVTTVILTMGGTFISLSWIKYLRWWQRSAWWTASSAGKRYMVWTTMRTCLLFVMGAWNITVYFGGAGYATSAKYCILITLIAALFCIPGRSEYDRFKTNK